MRFRIFLGDTVTGNDPPMEDLWIWATIYFVVVTSIANAIIVWTLWTMYGDGRLA